jgi:hypothetical protein
MKFKIGDKVKFLNEVGGGVITKIISPSMVCVAIEEGFEYPVSTAEIIPAIQEESGSKAFNVDFNTKSTSIPKIDIPEVDSDDEDFEREIPLQKFTSLNSSKNGLYLAFIPHDQVWLLKDMIDIYIVNKTSYDVIYNLFLRTEEKTYKGVDFGSISPQSRYFIETIAREELNEWCNGHFQAIFHADHIKSPLAPFNSSFQIKASRFVSKDSFVTSSFMEEKAILYFLGDCIEENIEMPSKDEIKKIDFQAPKNTKAEIVERHSFLQKYLKDADSAEVDLHIESIVEESDLIQEDPENLDSIQILQIQLSHFERCLNEAIRLKLKKIIFIHGVGIGKLKGEIKKAMNKYPDIHYFEASGLKYGSGAIEVWIK